MTASSTETRDELLARLLPRLVDLGFRKRAGSILTSELSDEVIGWLSVQTTIRRDEDVVAVDPTIGVRHQALERDVADLRGERWHQYQPPTVSQLLGYVSSDESPALLVASSSDVDGVIDAVVHDVDTAGSSYLSARASLAPIVEDLRTGRAPGIDHISVRLPVGAWMLGDRDGAVSYVQQRMSELGDREDLAAEHYRRFAEAFTAAHPSP